MNWTHYTIINMCLVIMFNTLGLSHEPNINDHNRLETYTTIASPLKHNKTYRNTAVSKLLKAPVYFDYDANVLKNITQKTQAKISFELPLNNQRTVRINLDEVAPDFYDCQLYYGDNQRYIGALPDRKHFTGKVAGYPQSTVAISLLEDEVIGIIAIANEPTYTIGKLSDDSQMHIIYQENAIDLAPTICGTSDHSYAELTDHINSNMMTKSGNGGNNCVNFDFDVTPSLYARKGSHAATYVFVEALYNVVAMLFRNENIQTQRTKVFIHLLGADEPANEHKFYAFNFDDTRSNDLLAKYQDHIEDVGLIGDVSMLLTHVNGEEGGLATRGGLCHTDEKARTGVAAISDSDNILPTYGRTTKVITHEFGHLLGSPHTHACLWGPNNDTAIDSCEPVDGNCSAPGLPAAGGTMMSYCDLNANSFVDFALGFGPEPGNLIRNFVANAACLTPCCIENQVITNTIVSNDEYDYEVSNDILANNIIEANAIVEYDAGHLITLQTGFRAATGSQFSAFIDGCYGTKLGIDDGDENTEVPPIKTPVSGTHPNSNTETDQDSKQTITLKLTVQPTLSEDGLFTVGTEGFNFNKSITIYNVSGQLITRLNMDTDLQTIDLSTVAGGLYLLQVSDGIHQKTEKITIK